MSKLIPIACLALLGTAGHAWALPQSSDQAVAADPNSPSTTAKAPKIQQKGVLLRLADNIEQGRHGVNAGLAMPGNVYGLWKLNAGSQPRLSANKLDPRLYETARGTDTGPLYRAPRRWPLHIELSAFAMK